MIITRDDGTIEAYFDMLPNGDWIPAAEATAQYVKEITPNGDMRILRRRTQIGRP